MCNEDGSCWLTLNGEIYDWRALRAALLARGHRVRGTGDAELLLHLYEEHGNALMPHLRGEFAFALFDRRARTLLLARDRVGVKPLYYHDDGHRLVFASEMKALLLDPSVPREVDEQAIIDFLAWQYVPGPGTIWKGVKKLPPGHILTCGADGCRLERYWTLPVSPDENVVEAEAPERLFGLLDDAVRVRLDADAPIGAALSGGIDSSTVVALMSRASARRVKTFCIGFAEEDFSELRHARAVARHLGTDHHELVVTPRALETLPRLVWGLDEPFADASILPTYYLSQMARSQVTVLISGDGGDETLAGYKTYPAALRHQSRGHLPALVRQMIGAASHGLPPAHPMGRRIRRIPMTVLERHLEAMTTFPPRELAPLLAPGLRSLLRARDPYAASREIHARAALEIGEVPALLNLDAETYMPDDVLKKVECASMLNSLEVRVPFLDHQVIEYVARLPFRFKWRDGVSKWILKQSMKALLPASTLRRAKKGFTVPLERWFGDGFDRLVRETLLDSRARRRGWLDTARVEHLVRNRSRGSSGQQLWSLVCLELWAQCYLDQAFAGGVEAGGLKAVG